MGGRDMIPTGGHGEERFTNIHKEGWIWGWEILWERRIPKEREIVPKCLAAANVLV